MVFDESQEALKVVVELSEIPSWRSHAGGVMNGVDHGPPNRTDREPGGQWLQIWIGSCSFSKRD